MPEDVLFYFCAHSKFFLFFCKPYRTVWNVYLYSTVFTKQNFLQNKAWWCMRRLITVKSWHLYAEWICLFKKRKIKKYVQCDLKLALSTNQTHIVQMAPKIQTYRTKLLRLVSFLRPEGWLLNPVGAQDLWQASEVSGIWVTVPERDKKTVTMIHHVDSCGL